jgi:hypothetical protein
LRGDASPRKSGIAGASSRQLARRRSRGAGSSQPALTGTTGLLVSPISWTHHWVWILPALVVLLRGGTRSRIAAGCGYVLFVLAPMWWTPQFGPGTGANCFLLAGSDSSGT